MKERTLVFGPNDGLLGTLALPAASVTDTSVLLLNAGTIHRVGPHRINVRLARHLAAHGVASMRFDLAGHGDSARLTGEHSFASQAVMDILAATDALTAASRTRRVAIFGICSGAYHAYSAALRDRRITGLLMYDAYRYPNIKTHIIRYARACREPGLGVRVIRSLGRGATAIGSWMRVTRRSAARSSRNESRPGGIGIIPTRADFANGLKTLLDRGVRVHMIYSGDAPEEYNYANQFRDTVSPFGIGERIRAEFLPDADHQLSAVADQLDTVRRVTDWIDGFSPAIH